MVDYLWLAIGVGAVACAALLIYSVARQMAGGISRRLGQLDLAVGVVGLAYVAIVVANGGFIFVIGAISALGLLALGLLTLRRDANTV